MARGSMKDDINDVVDEFQWVFLGIYSISAESCQVAWSSYSYSTWGDIFLYYSIFLNLNLVASDANFFSSDHRIRCQIFDLLI